MIIRKFIKEGKNINKISLKFKYEDDVKLFADINDGKIIGKFVVVIEVYDSFLSAFIKNLRQTYRSPEYVQIIDFKII